MATPNTTPSSSIDLHSYKRFLVNVRHADVAQVSIEKADFVITLKSGKKVVIQQGAAYAKKDASTTFLFLDDQEVAANTFLEASQGTEASYVQAPSESSSLASPQVSPSASSTSAEGEAFNYGNKALGAPLLLLAASAGGGGGGGGSVGGNMAQPVNGLTQDRQLIIKAAAGPMINQQLIKVYGSDGVLITSTVMTDGTCTLTLTSHYTGPILIEMSDTNAAGVD